MGKTASRVKSIVAKYVAVLDRQIEVERILQTNMRDPGEEDLDLQLLVISPSFEGMEWTKRSDLVSLARLEVPELITAWAFTPREIAMHESRERYELFLAHALAESREVYHKAPAGVSR